MRTLTAALALAVCFGAFTPHLHAQRSGGGAAAGTNEIGTERVATGLARPVFVTHAPGDANRLFIVEARSGTTGRVRILDLNTGVLNPTPFISVPGVNTASEQGLLGLAFHPNYAQNGHFYVHFTNSANGSVIRRYTVSGNPNIADPNSAFTIMTVSQPFSNHNAGWLEFGPDGYLYIPMGDGGSGGDPGNRAQNLGMRLGKMLRIDVDGGSPFAIPPTNPFVGTPGALDEIWAYGLRNPWRAAFDSQTGDLYIADVGQNAWEEIDFQPANSTGGENYGWRCYEGNNPFNLTGCPPPGTMVFPIHVYGIAGNSNCAVIGGEIYRGQGIPDLDGTYFFGDHCSARVWSFRYVNGQVTNFIERTAQLQPPAGQGSLSQITSFGKDANGEMYITTLGGNVYRIHSTAEPIPANNDCADAIAVGEGIFNSSNVGATTTGPDEPGHCDFFGDTHIANDVWFTHTAQCTGDLTVDLCASNFAAKVGIYGENCPAGSGEIIACSVAVCGTRGKLTIPVTAGQTYTIRIGGHLGATGDIVLDISCEAGAACPADLNNSGAVDVQDLLILLGAWGPCDDCPEDLNNSGAVDVQDLLILLGAWGPCE